MDDLLICRQEFHAGFCALCMSSVCAECATYCAGQYKSGGCYFIGGCNICQLTEFKQNAWICHVCNAQTWGFEVRHVYNQIPEFETFVPAYKK